MNVVKARRVCSYIYTHTYSDWVSAEGKKIEAKDFFFLSGKTVSGGTVIMIVVSTRGAELGWSRGEASILWCR